MKRRHFFYYAGSSLVVSHLLTQTTSAQPMSLVDPGLHLKAWLPDGQPLPEEQLQRLYFLDLSDEPLPNAEHTVEAGLLVSQPPPQWPVAVALQMPVDGFGDVTLYADNQGRGFGPQDFPLRLNRAFARDRIYRVNQALNRWRQQGYGFPVSITDRLERAHAQYQQAEQTDALPRQIRLWNDALNEALWAGEEAALGRARQRIVRRAPRHDFKFGCNAFGYPQMGSDYDQYFKTLFNFATVPFYWKTFEPEQGKPQFDRVDQQVAWLQEADIIPKGHPLVWFHDVGVPDWMRDQSYPTVKAALRQRILEITRHYGDRIPYYDVINEAHDVPWGNELGYSPEQFIDLTRMACETAREGSPGVERIVNNCCLWARQVALYGPPQRSPFRYIQACLEADIPFEIIGLQLYYPDQDMFEIDRMLDRFTQFGKPLHITEMAVSSNTGIHEQSLLKDALGLWHAPWSETVQADWVEQAYTLAYSKPEITAITWWDLSDQGTFWPFGGLLDQDNQPKRAYYRLQGLQQAWGLR